MKFLKWFITFKDAVKNKMNLEGFNSEIIDLEYILSKIVFKTNTNNGNHTLPLNLGGGG